MSGPSLTGGYDTSHATWYIQNTSSKTQETLRLLRRPPDQSAAPNKVPGFPFNALRCPIGHVIGFVDISPTERTGLAGDGIWELTYDVRPDWQGKGIATALVRLALGYAAFARAKRVVAVRPPFCSGIGPRCGLHPSWFLSCRHANELRCRPRHWEMRLRKGCYEGASSDRVRMGREWSCGRRRKEVARGKC